MSKSQKKHNNGVYDDYDKPHHQVKQLKKRSELKTLKRINSAIKSKNVNKLFEIDDIY